MDVKLLATQAALQKMVSSNHFDICTIDRIASMLDIRPEAEAYEILHTLHCVHYNQMHPDLLAAMPALIHQALRSPRFAAADITIIQSNGQLRLVKG